MKNYLHFITAKILSLLGLVALLLSCSDADGDNMKSPVQGVPFRSIYVEVDQERVKAEIPDIKKREQIFKKIFALALEKEGNVSEEEIHEILRKEGERNG